MENLKQKNIILLCPPKLLSNLGSWVHPYSLNTVDNANWIYSTLLMSQLPTQPQLSRISIVPS